MLNCWYDDHTPTLFGMQNQSINSSFWRLAINNGTKKIVWKKTKRKEKKSQQKHDESIY